MAKKKNVAASEESDFMTEIALQSGGKILSDVGIVPYYVDTGNLAINWQLSGKFINGGFPGGRLIEAYGPEASGKSLLGYCFLGNIQRMGGIGVLLDCERASGAEFAERCGHVDTKKLLVYDPITLKAVEKKITTLIPIIRKRFPDVPIGIVWDSIGVCPADREWNETELPENPTKEQIKEAGGNERPGERAKETNSVLRKLNPFLNEHNATLYVINQVRKKIGVMFGDPETTAGGGEALKYYASIRIRTGAPKCFRNKTTKMPLGVNMSVTNKKNRHNTPGIKIENVPLFFSGGINPLGGLMDALVLAERVKGSGTYEVCEPWANGDSGKFKQSKVNPMNPEILYRWPKLVDANDESEVKKYLSEWSEAMKLTESDSVEAIGGEESDEDLENLDL
jgi:recombination protein RecA